MDIMGLYTKFMEVMPLFCFLVVLIVQVKIIRQLRSHQNLIIFYGKQIEELRKMSSGGAGYTRRLPEVPPDESGLYEVLKE